MHIIDYQWTVHLLASFPAFIHISCGQYTQYPGSTNGQYQSGQFQQPYQYGQYQYTTQTTPYAELYPNDYGNRGIYGSQMTSQYSQDSTTATIPYMATNPYVQVSEEVKQLQKNLRQLENYLLNIDAIDKLPLPPVLPTRPPKVTSECDITAQQKLASCAQQLISLGIFGAPGSQLGQMTLSRLKQQPSDFLLQVCNAYSRFNQCVGGTNIKYACYVLEPLRLRYAIADAGLDFLCGQGYRSMLSNWNCLVQATSSSDVNECDSRLLQNTVASQFSTNALADGSSWMCSTLQTYVDCIKNPIENSCGNDAWNTVVMMIERQARVVHPFCTLGAGAIVPSLLLIAVSLLISFAS